MQNKLPALLITGFFILGVAVSAVAAAAPAPSEPPTFFSTLAPSRFVASAATVAPTAAPTDAPAAASADEIARPSNPGGPGSAVALTGSVEAGKAVFTVNCVKCHGQQGTGGVVNPGSDDGTVPPLNPIDDTLVSKDTTIFATNLDLFVEHGSTPSGSAPVLSMPNWGDSGKLKPQQIADVIAYVMSLNK